MYCNQCKHAQRGGCKVVGVCGKNEEISSLQDLIINALKGVSAYATHARQLGSYDEEVNRITHEALYMTLTNSNFDLNEHLEMAIEVGSAAVLVMDMLDKAHTAHFGIPEPITVTQNKIEGHSIVVTGHNLYALEELLKQTEGTGINVYTHSEMLPAHGYPALKRYPHLKGNVGKSWHDQRRLFEEFPGAILATTNCVMQIRGTYGYRFFTYDVVGMDDVTKIENDDFSPLIRTALALPKAEVSSDLTLSTGFHHQTVIDFLPQLVDAVRSGKIKRFFVIAGCDSPGPGGNYYRELAQSLPDDTVILTTSCGKFRFNDLEFGTIDGTIPRYIDLGQCNNSISVVKIVLALSDALRIPVEQLPVSIVLSWFEQKAIAILLGLFSLGIQDIRIGPKPPEFISAGVLKVLQETFGLKMITTAEEDLIEMLPMVAH